MIRRTSAVLLAGMLASLPAAPAHAAPAGGIVFPPKANVIDVTKPPYNADPTGKADATAAINRAIADSEKARKGWANQVVYLPDGTYLVTDTIRWKAPPHTIGPHMVGQSREGTVIRLADGTWPKGEENKPVLHTGRGVAQNFNRGLSNLTVNTGSNNAGACGVYWYGNNQALMSDVDIVSEDGRGRVGLDLGHWQRGGGEQGPCMVRRVRIRGFDVGVTSNALNAVTFLKLHLEGQRALGILNDNHPIYLDALTSRNRVPALRSEGGFVVLTDATLTGGDAGRAAIEKHKWGAIFVRNTTVGGYGKAVVTDHGVEHAAGKVEEFLDREPVSLFGEARRSLNLPVKYPPEPPWETDPRKWATPDEYRRAGMSDAAALQAAIDDAKITTIVLPRGRNYVLDEPVRVRGTVGRIISTGGTLNGKGAIIIADGQAPVVKLEKLSMGSMDRPFPHVEQASARTVVCESILLGTMRVAGPGDVFLTDVVHHLLVDHPTAHVWAWHFDAEGSRDDNLIVRDGTVRIFGWKDEGMGQPLHCHGGATEILGFLEYSAARAKGEAALVTITGEARVSVACLSQTNFARPPAHYRVLVRETRGGVERTLTADKNAMGAHVALFVARPPQ